MTRFERKIMSVVLFATFVCGCAPDDLDPQTGAAQEKSPLMDMQILNLVLPFPDNERHTVTQIENGEVSHSGNGYELSVDFSGREGSPVVAPMSGYVRLLSLRAASCPSADGMPTSGQNAGFGNHLYIESGNGFGRVHLGHLSSVTVRDGRWVNQGQVVGYEGSTGCATGPNIHMDCSMSDESGNWQPARCRPLSGYTSFAVGQVLGGNEYVNLPVGTTVQAFGLPEIYLVCAPNTLCHIADWDAYRTRRYFYDSMRPTEQVVMVAPSALDCYARGEPIAGISERYIIECGDGFYLVIREDGQAVRRWIRYEPDAWAPERDVLLMSWGVSYDFDLRGYSLSECWNVPEGEPLLLRDGTVVEFPDDNDFYVVTGEQYESEATDEPEFAHGQAYRLNRSQDGEPFFPLLYGSFSRVLQIQRSEMPYLVSGIVHGGEFGPDEARECRYGDGLGGPGEDSYCGDRQCDDGEDCGSCVGDCGACPVYCGDGNCNVGESCHNCEADCGVCAESVCGDGICQLDEGLYECPTDCADGPFCGDGVCATDEDGAENCLNCELDCGVCTEDPPETDDPPFTIRCTIDGDTVHVQFTGPVLERLIGGDELTGTPTGIYLGSNGFGRWNVPYGTSDPRPRVPWPGGDGSCEMDVPLGADGLNFAVADSAGHVAWFDIEREMSAATWNLTGDCRVDGTLIYFEPDADGGGSEEARCGDNDCDSGESCSSCPSDCGVCGPFCGDGSCDTDESCRACPSDCGDCPEPEPDDYPAHTIECVATDYGLELLIYGPVTDMLIGGTLSGPPVGIYAGCNNCGGWSVPYGDSDERPLAVWAGDSEIYSLLFPSHASGINLAAVDASGHAAWFDIETAYDARRWSVTGDCRIEGTLIVQN